MAQRERRLASASRALTAVAGVIGALSAVAGLVALFSDVLTPAPTGPPTASPTPTSTATATATPADGDGGLELPATVGWILVGSLALGLTAEGFRRLLVSRNRRRREELDALIKEHAGVESSELRERVVKQAKPDDQDIALKQVETYLLDEGPELREVEQVILRHPPPLPRAAKRMLNHARLLTRIANERGMFGGEPPLQPAHLGKWIVLAERWPAVAREVVRDPDALGRLEAALGEDGDLATAAEAAGLEVVPSTDLRDLIGESPRLSPVIGRLIHFDRAPA